MMTGNMLEKSRAECSIKNAFVVEKDKNHSACPRQIILFNTCSLVFFGYPYSHGRFKKKKEKEREKEMFCAFMEPVPSL